MNIKSSHTGSYQDESPSNNCETSSTMRVPLVAHIIYRFNVGGLENGLVNLINHMPVNRYRHVIICLKDYSDFSQRLTRDDVQIYALHKKEGKDLLFYFRLWKILRGLKPDIVHTRNLGTLDCVFPALLAGVPHRIHGEHGWDMSDLYGANRKYRLLRRICIPFLDRCIALSSDLEFWLKKQIRIPERKLEHIYNGVDTDKFHPAADGRENLPVSDLIPEDAFVIGTIGRMSDVKDQPTLVRAFIHLMEIFPEAEQKLRLVMVGDGPLLQEVRSMLVNAGIIDLAWLPGSRDDIPNLLRGFDIFILPSLNEGISNTILEAMSSGLPVIASNVGGNPELVQQDKTGMLFPASDYQTLARAIRDYIESPEMIREHGHAGRARVMEQFSLDAMVQSYLSVYDSLMLHSHRY